MSNISSVIEKVKKLLALSKSSNANEAAAAAALANNLIDQHRLSEADFSEVQEEIDPLIEDDGFVYETGRIIPWKSSLVVTLAKHYGCALFNSADFSSGRKFSRYKLIGRKSDIDITKYMFSWLTAECQRLSESEARGKGKIFAASYCQGFVSGVSHQLNLSRKEVQQNASQAAIVKINAREQEATNLMHQMHKLKNSGQQSAARINPYAFDAGMNRGKQIHLGGAMNADAPIKMLGGG